MKLLVRRGIAFLIDLNLYLMFWGVADNLIAIALPDGFVALVKGACFALYVAAVTAVSPAVPSPGKLLLGLRVVSADGTRLTRARVLMRSLVPGLLLITDWPEVVRSVVSTPLPMWLALAAAAIPRGLVAYGVLSAVLDRSGLMPYDRWTRTRVSRPGEVPEQAPGAPSDAGPSIAAGNAADSEAHVPGPVTVTPVTPATPPPSPVPLPSGGRLALAGAAIAIAVALALQGEVMTKGAGRWAVVAGSEFAADDFGYYFGRMMREVVGVRSRAEFERARYRQKDGTYSREVRIRFWLPYAAMNTRIMDEALRSTFATLWLVNASCDTVRIVFWTGEQAARIELECPVAVRPLPADRGLDGAEDTLCVPVAMPPTKFHAQLGPWVYEPLFESHLETHSGLDGRLLLREGSGQRFLHLRAPYALTLCVRLRRAPPAPGAQRVAS